MRESRSSRPQTSAGLWTPSCRRPRCPCLGRGWLPPPGFWSVGCRGLDDWMKWRCTVLWDHISRSQLSPLFWRWPSLYLFQNNVLLWEDILIDVRKTIINLWVVLTFCKLKSCSLWAAWPFSFATRKQSYKFKVDRQYFALSFMRLSSLYFGFRSLIIANMSFKGVWLTTFSQYAQYLQLRRAEYVSYVRLKSCSICSMCATVSLNMIAVCNCTLAQYVSICAHDVLFDVLNKCNWNVVQ